MTGREALEIVLDLASQNALDVADAMGDPGLEDEMELQQQAMEMVAEMIEKS